MKPEASRSNNQIANKGNEKDCIMSILQAVAYALGRQVHEQKIGKGVDKLGDVVSDNIVLATVSSLFCPACLSDVGTDLFAPIQSRRDGRKPAVLFRRVRY